MDCHHCITEYAERKKGQHLRMEDRGAIKVLKKQGLGPRAIARQIGCAPSTVTNELRRGTPTRKSNKGKAPGYSPKLGEAVYRANRASCHRHPKAGVCSNFTSWVVRQIREHKWSLDACCGYAKRHDLFEPSEMVCSRTLYNMVWKGHLSIQPMELPEALKRKAKKHRVRENKKRYGTSISSRPEIASLRLEEGHWEGDTVVGKRAGKEAVVFLLLHLCKQRFHSLLKCLRGQLPGLDVKGYGLFVDFILHLPSSFRGSLIVLGWYAAAVAAHRL